MGDRFKRREIFNWLKCKKMSVYFIQEVHCIQENINDWRDEWGYQALFSCCSSNKGSVAILFNENFSFQLLKVYTDPKGWFIICDLITNGKHITLANVYAPNEDDPNFFTSVVKSSVLPIHVPRPSRMQYRVSVGGRENVSRTDSEHWQCHPKISVRNTCSSWGVCESSLWQPRKRQRKARAVLKRQETSPAYLQTERHLFIMPRG